MKLNFHNTAIYETITLVLQLIGHTCYHARIKCAIEEKDDMNTIKSLQQSKQSVNHFLHITVSTVLILLFGLLGMFYLVVYLVIVMNVSSVNSEIDKQIALVIDEQSS